MANLGIRAAQGMSYKRAESEAEQLRALLGFSRTEPLDHRDIVSRFRKGTTMVSGVTLHHDFVVEEISAEGCSRVTCHDGRLWLELVLSESTARALCEGAPRALFSLAHELSHCVVHPRELLELLVKPRGLHREPDHDPCFDTEFQANAVGSAFLMPATGLRELRNRGAIDEFVITETYGVSTAAARHRLRVWRERLDPDRRSFQRQK